MFTFKCHKETGLAAVASSGYTDIKIKRKSVGVFDNRKLQIRLAVRDEISENSGNSFRWVTLKYQPTSQDDAKAFLRRNYDEIVAKYDLHRFED